MNNCPHCSQGYEVGHLHFGGVMPAIPKVRVHAGERVSSKSDLVEAAKKALHEDPTA